MVPVHLNLRLLLEDRPRSEALATPIAGCPREKRRWAGLGGGGPPQAPPPLQSRLRRRPEPTELRAAARRLDLRVALDVRETGSGVPAAWRSVLRDVKERIDSVEHALALAVSEALGSGDLYLPESRQHVSFWNIVYGANSWKDRRAAADVESQRGARHAAGRVRSGRTRARGWPGQEPILNKMSVLALLASAWNTVRIPEILHGLEGSTGKPAPKEDIAQFLCLNHAGPGASASRPVDRGNESAAIVRLARANRSISLD